MPSINTVLFDWDDTLIHSLPTRVKTLKIIFARAGIPELDAKAFLLGTKGGSLQKALIRLQADSRIKENLFDAYRRTYWYGLKGCSTLFPGITDMLGNLKADGFCLGIVTGKFRDLEFEGRRIGCKSEIQRTGLEELFAVVIGLEDVKNHKPHPEGVNLALSRLRTKPGKTLVVGDSDADIDAAVAAGCVSCRAIWGSDKDSPTEVKADFIARQPADVLDIVKKT